MRHRIGRRLRQALGLAIASGLAAAALRAQAVGPDRSGPFVGLDPLTFAALRSDAVTGDRAAGGFGLGLRFGWDLTPHLALVLDAAATDLVPRDTAQVAGHGDLLLRVSPRAFRVGRHALVPFVEVGVGLLDVTMDPDAVTSGPRIRAHEGTVLAYGGGLAWYLRRCWSLHGAVHANTGEFTDRRLGMTTTHGLRDAVRTTRVSFGITTHAPFRC